MGKIFHALVLNLHQPAGNLEALLATNEWEVREILFALDRIPRSLWGYEDVARVHLSLSGTLLETLSRPAFQERVHGIGRHVFWRTNFSGFWPPEMAFCMEMIPLLKRLGYRYVIVDSEHVEPLTSMRWEEIRYRPHWARYNGAEIVVV